MQQQSFSLEATTSITRSICTKSPSHKHGQTPVAVICPICLSEITTIVEICTGCDSTYCRDCLSLYLKHLIFDGSMTKLVCPAVGCNSPFDAKQIQHLVSEAIFAKYIRFQIIHHVERGRRFCPRPECGKVLEEKRFSHSRRAYCHTCKKTSCMRCTKAYHRFGLCAVADPTYEQWRRKNDVRQCPKCRWEIEKSGGCQHMACSRCSHEFCWQCLAPWEEHREWLCMPASLLHSRNRWFGPTRPIRAVTKTATACVGALAVVAGTSVVILLGPFVLAYDDLRYRYASRRWRENQQTAATECDG